MKRLLAAAAVGALLLAGCSSGGGGGDGASAELRVASEQDPLSIDPISIDTGDYLLLPNLETLTTVYTNPQEVQPLLATDWEASDDARTWVFHLREEVTFQDGTPFNAEAVKFTMDRVLDPDIVVAHRGEVDIIESTTVVDEYTVEFQLSEPRSFFPLSMAESVTGIISPDSIDQNGNTREKLVDLVGTGPYKIESYTRGQNLVYTANPDYWGDEPAYDRVTYNFVGEAPAREAMLRSGEVDVILSPSVTSLESLENDGFNVETAPSSTPIVLALNTTGANQPLLQDARVRQALNYAIDRDAITSSLLEDMTSPLNSPLSDEMPGHCEVGSYDYDPDRARELLSEAGAEGMSLALLSPNGRYLQDMPVANAIAGYYTDIGIEVEGPQTSEFGEYVDRLWSPPAEGDWDAALIAFNAAPHAGRALFYANGGKIPPDGSNIAGYDSPTVNGLLSEAYAEVDEEAAADLYCQAQQEIWEDAPWVFLWTQSHVFVTNDSVEGYTILPNLFPTFLEARPTS